MARHVLKLSPDYEISIFTLVESSSARHDQLTQTTPGSSFVAVAPRPVDSFEVVTADDDGAHGVGSRTPLRVMPEAVAKRDQLKSVKGSLAGKLPDLSWDDFEDISREVTALVDGNDR